MSFDQMAFEPSAAPKNRKAFMAWFEQQTRWQESHGYNNPDVCSPALKTWYLEMIKTYPPMNGPLAKDDPDDAKVTDFSVGRLVIYGAFAWSEAEAAREVALRLAAKHQIGFLGLAQKQLRSFGLKSR